VWASDSVFKYTTNTNVVLNYMTSVNYELKKMREIAVMAYFKILSKSLTELFRFPAVSLLVVVIDLTMRH
jgi:hypothetical protein